MYEYYEKTFSIRSSETDLQGHLRPQVLMGMLQDVATDHAALQDIGRDYLIREYHAAWLLARNWYRLCRPIRQDEALSVRTNHRGPKGVTIYRDFLLRVGEEVVGEAVSAWVVADLVSRKMLRGTAVEHIAQAAFPADCGTRQLRVIRPPEERTLVYTRTVRLSDLDVNGHMNNTHYADLALDALEVREVEGHFLSELQLNYTKECLPGQTLEILRRDLDPGRIYVDGVAGGERRFEAVMTFENNPSRSGDSS